MEKICLDYSAALDFLKGEKTVAEKLNYYINNDEICISALTLAHLLYTVKKQDVIISFANSVTILPIDRKAVVVSSKLRNELAENANEISHETLMNAAVCIVNDAFLFTRRAADYEKIKGLKRV